MRFAAREGRSLRFSGWSLMLRRDLSETIQCLREVDSLDSLEERQDVPVRLAPEAVEVLSLRIDGEGRDAIIVEGAVANEASALRTECHAGTYDLLQADLALEALHLAPGRMWRPRDRPPSANPDPLEAAVSPGPVAKGTRPVRDRVGRRSP